MLTSHPEFTKAEFAKAATIPIRELKAHATDWLFDCELRLHSPRTIGGYREIVEKLFWFVEHRRFESVGTPELKLFAAYLNNGHTDPGGRWGNPRMVKAMSRASMQDYLSTLRIFFNWLEKEDILEFNPMRKVRSVIVRQEVKQPISSEHMQALMQAARCSKHSKRNEAVLMLLYDSGIRISEAIQLRRCDMDLYSRTFHVVGKGNKRRVCFVGRSTAKSLAVYLRTYRAEPDAPLFQSERGGAMTRSGLAQLIRGLCVAAGIPKAGISAHAFRRSFAVETLRSGADLFAVQNFLGHTNLAMTRRYCATSNADLERQHRLYSPIDRLKL